MPPMVIAIDVYNNRCIVKLFLGGIIGVENIVHPEQEKS
jgi:hypothetical protein